MGDITSAASYMTGGGTSTTIPALLMLTGAIPDALCARPSGSRRSPPSASFSDANESASWSMWSSSVPHWHRDRADHQGASQRRSRGRASVEVPLRRRGDQRPVGLARTRWKGASGQAVGPLLLHPSTCRNARRREGRGVHARDRAQSSARRRHRRPGRARDLDEVTRRSLPAVTCSHSRCSTRSTRPGPQARVALELVRQALEELALFRRLFPRSME